MPGTETRIQNLSDQQFRQPLTDATGISIFPEAHHNERISFYRLLLEAGEQEWKTHHVGLDQFYTYYRSFGFSPEVVLSGFFYKTKEQQKDSFGNAGNYIAQAAEASVQVTNFFGREALTIDAHFETGESQQGLKEVFDNMLAMVVEHPIAQVEKRESRTQQWLQTYRGIQLQSVHGYLDDILREALVSSQTLDFELSRFKANFLNYQKLKQGRTTGSTQTFVEFSPSPVMTPEAKARGYQGQSCIFFYRVDSETGVETVEQRWIPAQWSDFQRLLEQLELRSEGQMTDVAIMQQSDFFSEAAVGKIYQFIKDQNGSIEPRKEQLATFIVETLRPLLVKEIQLVLVAGAAKIIAGQDVSQEKNHIMTTLAYLQLRLQNEIDRVYGTQLAPVTLTQTQIYLLDISGLHRGAFVTTNEIPLAGCGYGSASSSNPIERFLASASLGDFLVPKLGSDLFGQQGFLCEHCKGYHIRSIGALITECTNVKDENNKNKKMSRC